MNYRRYLIQDSRDAVPSEILGFDRVDYNALLNSLRYPVVWCFDEYLEGWLPAEVFSTLDFSVYDDDELRRVNLIAPEGRVDWNALKERALAQGWVTIPSLIPSEYARGTLSDHFWRQGTEHQRWPEMMGIKRLSINNMPIMRYLHQVIEKKVKLLVNEKIKTSYSFASAYEAGSSLPEHTDRPQCIYNISLLLSGTPSTAPLTRWPLYIKRPKITPRVELNAGDAVLYSGTRDPHWRDTMPSALTSVLGVFFHFVTESFKGSLD